MGHIEVAPRAPVRAGRLRPGRPLGVDAAEHAIDAYWSAAARDALRSLRRAGGRRPHRSMLSERLASGPQRLRPRPGRRRPVPGDGPGRRRSPFPDQPRSWPLPAGGHGQRGHDLRRAPPGSERLMTVIKRAVRILNRKGDSPGALAGLKRRRPSFWEPRITRMSTDGLRRNPCSSTCNPWSIRAAALRHRIGRASPNLARPWGRPRSPAAGRPGSGRGSPGTGRRCAARCRSSCRAACGVRVTCG